MDDPNYDWNAEIPNFAQESFIAYLAQLDWQNGRTKHPQTYCGFLRAATLGVDPQYAYDAIVRCIVDAGGVLDLMEVRRQQCRAAEYLDSHPGSISAFRDKPPAPVFLPKKLAEVAAKVEIPDAYGFLRARSPIPPASTTPAGFLDALYAPSEKILIFTEQRSQGQCLHVVGGPGEGVIPAGGPDGVWYLIQPVDGQYHRNPRSGNMSRRSEEAITAWRYLLLEADEADPGDWIRALVQLPLRIAAIYTSGGRSVHALVRVDAASKAAWDEIKDAIKFTVVTLGADPQALTAVRLSRLPNCRRGDRLQELLYLDPNANGTPIIEKGGAHE